MMLWWQAVILGLVEGITEFLPVSSTGHLILTSAFLGLDTPEQKAAVDALQIVIQGGAILAVAIVYKERVRQLLYGVIKSDAGGRKLLTNLIVGFLPAAFLGVLFDDLIEQHLFRPMPVLGALFVGGVLLIVLSALFQKNTSLVDVDQLKASQALTIGLLQCLAMWPGTSRSLVTILGGLWVGLSAAQAAQFSFLLGLPTLGGASLYKLYKNLHLAKVHATPNLFESLGVGPVVIGIAVATISAALAVRWLVRFLENRTLAVFGWYRVVFSLLIGFMMLQGWLDIRP